MKRLFFLAIAGGILLAAGCANSADKLPPPKSTSVLILNPDDRQVLRTMILHTALKIVLPAPEAGPPYVWEIVSNMNTILRPMTMVKAVPHPTPKQAYEVTFQAVHTGRSTIRFAAVKPGPGESTPDDLYQIAIGVREEGE